MSQSESKKPKYPKVHIRNKPGAEGALSVGSNMEILLDGKKLGSAYFCKFEVHSRKIAKVTIEMYAEVEIETNALLEKTSEEDSEYFINNQPVPVWTLSNYRPKFYADKKVK